MLARVDEERTAWGTAHNLDKLSSAWFGKTCLFFLYQQQWGLGARKRALPPQKSGGTSVVARARRNQEACPSETGIFKVFGEPRQHHFPQNRGEVRADWAADAVPQGAHQRSEGLRRGSGRRIGLRWRDVWPPSPRRRNMRLRVTGRGRPRPGSIPGWLSSRGPRRWPALHQHPIAWRRGLMAHPTGAARPALRRPAPLSPSPLGKRAPAPAPAGSGGWIPLVGLQLPAGDALLALAGVPRATLAHRGLPRRLREQARGVVGGVGREQLARLRLELPQHLRVPPLLALPPPRRPSPARPAARAAPNGAGRRARRRAGPGAGRTSSASSSATLASSSAARAAATRSCRAAGSAACAAGGPRAGGRRRGGPARAPGRAPRDATG